MGLASMPKAVHDMLKLHSRDMHLENAGLKIFSNPVDLIFLLQTNKALSALIKDKDVQELIRYLVQYKKLESFKCKTKRWFHARTREPLCMTLQNTPHFDQRCKLLGLFLFILSNVYFYRQLYLLAADDQRVNAHSLDISSLMFPLAVLFAYVGVFFIIKYDAYSYLNRFEVEQVSDIPPIINRVHAAIDAITVSNVAKPKYRQYIKMMVLNETAKHHVKPDELMEADRVVNKGIP